MTRTTFCFPVLAAALLVAGCASSGHYVRQVPGIEVPARYRHGGPEDGAALQTLQALEPAPDADVRDDPWWQGFGDARLDRMVDQALAVNADLAAAGFALRQARLAARLSTYDMLPRPTAGANAERSRPVDRGSDTARSYDASVGLGWEIDLFGRLRAQREVSRWQAQASADDLHATALALVGEVCRNYWMLAYLNQSIGAGEQDLAALERIVGLVETRHAVGDTSLLELREAQQRLETRRAAQSVLLQQRVEVRGALAILLDGRPWPQHDEPLALEAVKALPVREGMPAELLGRRPDLRAAERRLRASRSQVDATARSYYPALSLTGALGSRSRALADMLDNPVAVLGVGLQLPFLDVGRMRADTGIAGAAYLQAASMFRNTLHTALQDTDNALSARDRLQAQVDARRRAYDAAQDVARMYEVRYREGESALRIWLDAQQDVRTAEIALAQAVRERVDNDVTLMMAFGGS